MTAYNTDQFDKITGGGVPEAHEYSGELRVAYFEYTSPSGNEAAGDTINLVRLPKGARVLTGQLHTDALAANADLTVGDADDSDRYLAKVDADSSTNVELNSPSEAGFGHMLSAQTDIVASFANGGMTSDDTIKGYIVYVPVG